MLEDIRSVLARIATLLGAGAIVGIALGTVAQGALDVVVYQASSRDPRLIVVVTIAMTLVGVCAAWIPARRAINTNPAQTLRGA